ncbi:hypothetical protein OTU49_000626 [Cherax quadricarinatus]|uniref:Uncharacterized protein n=1 Tax=Cherax quadricarinatus TaxID=27406 RepID=A0AAW0XZA9_CHEQU
MDREYNIYICSFHCSNRLLYIQAVRSGIDYGALALVHARPTNIKCLCVVQNTAVRAMLGAPRWANAVSLNLEAQLQPLEDRIQLVAAKRIAKYLRLPGAEKLMRDLRVY